MRLTMLRNARRSWRFTSTMMLALLALGGCETDSFMDPALVGRWEPTPVVLPILDKLDVIDEPTTEPPGVTQVLPEDLIPAVSEYQIAAGDVVSVSVFELINPGANTVQTLRVDDLGMFRHPVLGPIDVDGLTPTQLEKKVAEIVTDRRILRDPLVSAVVQQGQQNTFTMISDVNVSGVFEIISPDFRIMDAVAISRAVPFGTRKLYLYRPVGLDESAEQAAKPGGETEDPDVPTSIPDLIDDILVPDSDKGGSDESDNDAPAPKPIESGLDHTGAAQWINVDNKWVRLDGDTARAGSRKGMAGETNQDSAQTQPSVAQRIIEIPYEELLKGNMAYNVVVRRGDTIRVPERPIGNIYMGGMINRRGTFALPPDGITLKQAVFSAGGLAALAVPEKVDLIRRIGHDHEAFVRVNLRAIFEGRQPDIFMKPNDTVNVGSSFLSTPFAVFRNGFRATYGFGFVLDRNFGFDVFGRTNQRN